MIRGVALDMDGLLFDTERLYWEVGDTVLKRRGHRYSAELQQRMMGRIAIAAVQQMIDFHDLDDSPEDLLSECDELYVKMLSHDVPKMPGVDRWIETLQRRNLPFGVATSSRRRFVAILFEKIPWRDSLSFLLTGDDVQRGKPDPEMYLMAAERLSIEPTSMLVLEDSANGCAAALAAGAVTVAVPSEHTRLQDFRGVHLVADSLDDPRLAELLGSESSS